MKILVPVKRVPDWQIKLKLLPDGSGIQTDGIKWILNTFDEIAVEEAIRLKEKGIATEIVLVSIGPDDVRARLEYALAMGADSAILVKHDGPADSDLASRVIAEVFKKGEYSMILLGKQAIDSDANQTAQLFRKRASRPRLWLRAVLLLLPVRWMVVLRLSRFRFRASFRPISDSTSPDMLRYRIL
jgi:electron transfer flavoprotein beta subunit